MDKFLLERTKKNIEMLKNKYAVAYTTKDNITDIMAMYDNSVNEMKKDIIINGTANKWIDGVATAEAKIRIYKANESRVYGYPIDKIDELLKIPEIKNKNREFFSALKAEKAIKNYFENSGISFDEFEEKFSKINKMFAEREYYAAEQKQMDNLKEPAKFDPKKEIREMYKQLNKKDELTEKMKELKKEQIKSELVKYFTEQTKKQQSFYDVSGSKTFTKLGITNMVDIFKENPKKIAVNLENIKTSVLEDTKKLIKSELKQGLKKERRSNENSQQSRFISSVEPRKRNKLKELTFLNEELRVREELKKAEKHFGIKLSKIFGEETAQVKKEFHNLLRPEDSLVTAVKIVQQTFSSTYNRNPEKTNVVQQSLSSQIETASINSKKSNPEKTVVNPEPEKKLQATVTKKVIQRQDGLAEMDKNATRMKGNAQAFSETVKQLPKSQASTPKKKSKGINFPRFPQSNWNKWMNGLPVFRNFIKPMAQTTKVQEQNQEAALPRGFNQTRTSSIQRSNSQNANFQKRQPATVSRDRH